MTTSQAKWRGRRITPGVASWLAQRIGAAVLLITVPLKVASGYALSGSAPWLGGLGRIHTNGVLDGFMIGALGFHLLFGVRALLIDAGLIRTARAVTIPFGLLGAAVAVWAVVA